MAPNEWEGDSPEGTRHIKRNLSLILPSLPHICFILLRFAHHFLQSPWVSFTDNSFPQVICVHLVRLPFLHLKNTVHILVTLVRFYRDVARGHVETEPTWGETLTFTEASTHLNSLTSVTCIEYSTHLWLRGDRRSFRAELKRAGCWFKSLNLFICAFGLYGRKNPGSH